MIPGNHVKTVEIRRETWEEKVVHSELEPIQEKVEEVILEEENQSNNN